MKKKYLCLLLFLFYLSTYAQNGLEKIVIEKYYISNAADSIGSIGVLPVGSVTYRIYVDMLPGYEFQAAYGVPGHELRLETTTAFFNNEDRGNTTPTYTKTQAKANSVMLDSWLSVGAGCAANFGVLKTDDNTTTGGATVINNSIPPILQNNDPLAGIPLNTQDGLWAGITPGVTFVGISSADLALFDATSMVGNLFTTSNGSWASLNGTTGVNPDTNRVLIAQITTNGVFHYELNIQIGTPSGGTQNYVARNPAGTEILIPSMMGTLGGSNTPPTVSISSPATGASFITGANISLTATANDADGTISSVEFFVDGISAGTDNSSPYTATYTGATAGTHTITATATDNSSATTTSASVSITVNSNPAPTVSITSPANGASFITGTIIPIIVTATDNGSVTSVEFFVDGNSIGTDNSSPYSFNYTGTSGSHTLTANATDNLGAIGTSTLVTITVGSNPPPTVSITSPANGDLFVAPAVVTITADASDPNGTIASVNFYVNGSLVGTDATSPYSFNWTSTIGTVNLTARATDNLGAQTTSSIVTISIADPNIPYKIITTSNICLASTFCIPVTAIDTVDNVIGYDLVLHYNNTKVRPTGVITVSNDLINPSFIDVASNVDSVNGNINISLFFNTSAPSNSEFHGLGDIFCVEFSKKAAFTSTDTATFTISSINESYVTGVSSRLVDPGKYISYKDSVFNGTLRFWSNNSPVKYNSASPSTYLITNIYGTNNSCTNRSAVAVHPDTTGRFKYSIFNGQSISIEKDIAGTTSVQPVVNGFDVFLTRRVLINDPTFFPSIYQAIAMDVNMDGKISAGDASQINQRAVLMITEFKQAWNYDSTGHSNGQLSKDWIFIDSLRLANNTSYRISTTFPNDDGSGFSKYRVPSVPFCLPLSITNFSTCPLISNENFKGVLLGDIDGNYSSVSSGLFRESDEELIIVDTKNAIVNSGFIDIPVYLNSFNEINALDLALKFDEAEFSFISVAGINTSINAFAKYNSNDKMLRLTSNSLERYDNDKALFYLRFEIHSQLSKDFTMISSEGYLNGYRVKVQSGNIIPSGTEPRINVYPNPVKGILNITSSEDVSVRIFDLEGREVYYDHQVKANEKKEIDTRNLSNGVYMIRINNDEFLSIKKAIVEN
jgi:hypothetical protein